MVTQKADVLIFALALSFCLPVKGFGFEQGGKVLSLAPWEEMLGCGEMGVPKEHRLTVTPQLTGIVTEANVICGKTKLKKKWVMDQRGEGQKSDNISGNRSGFVWQRHQHCCHVVLLHP